MSKPEIKKTRELSPTDNVPLDEVPGKSEWPKTKSETRHEKKVDPNALDHLARSEFQ